MGRLERALKQSFDHLSVGGRISVITFHSLEDRIVKRFIKQKVDLGLALKTTKKPITPTDSEIIDNPRARSAKLRTLEKNEQNQD